MHATVCRFIISQLRAMSISSAGRRTRAGVPAWSGQARRAPRPSRSTRTTAGNRREPRSADGSNVLMDSPEIKVP